MRRALEPTRVFVRAAKRLLKRHPFIEPDLQSVLTLLAEDAFAPSLRTHKLKGRLAGCWAWSAGYHLRIVFEILPASDGEKICLLNVGTHDEVY